MKLHEFITKLITLSSENPEILNKDISMISNNGSVKYVNPTNNLEIEETQLIFNKREVINLLFS